MRIDKKGLSPLWEIDDITFGPFGVSSPHPRLFDRLSFVDAFLDVIYDIATTGDPAGVDALLRITTFADGEYGEYMEDKVLQLFTDHPNVILENWQAVRKYRASFGFETTSFPTEADNITENYQQICRKSSYGSWTCREIIDFLKQEKKKCEQTMERIRRSK
ncbi:MAG: hypothetical protein HY801_11310 [Candidatus Lindowbacteria bacterium]|nr:hypothetical protein [Candidatus Lindowbacteria bacterium]